MAPPATEEQKTEEVRPAAGGQPEIGPGWQPGFDDLFDQCQTLGSAEHEIVTPSLIDDTRYVVRQGKPDDFDALVEMMKAIPEKDRDIVLSKEDLECYYRNTKHPLEFVVWHENTDEARKAKKFMGLCIQHLVERAHPEELKEGDEVTPRYSFFAHWICHPDYKPIRDNVLKLLQRLPFHQTWSCKVNVGINFNNSFLVTSKFYKTKELRFCWYFYRIAETLRKYQGKPKFLLERVKSGLVLNDIKLENITESNLEEVIEYDRKAFPLYDREKFIRDWCAVGKPEVAYARVAYDEGEVVGYGVLRKHERCWTVEPLYCDYSEIATTMLVDFLKHAEAEDKPVYLICHAKNKELTDFLDLTLKWSFNTMMREYSVQSIEMDWSKTFCVYRDFHM